MEISHSTSPNSSDLAPVLEASIAAAREVESLLRSREVEVVLAPRPAAACCGGGCGCGSKLQVLVRPGDLERVKQILDEEWLASVRREGVVEAERLVSLRSSPDAEACPACGHSGPRTEGACSDCGLQLE
jgi:hypothetical protein